MVGLFQTVFNLFCCLSLLHWGSLQKGILFANSGLKILALAAQICGDLKHPVYMGRIPGFIGLRNLKTVASVFVSRSSYRKTQWVYLLVNRVKVFVKEILQMVIIVQNEG